MVNNKITPRAIIELLKSRRFLLRSEKDLQRDIHSALEEKFGLTVHREYILDPDNIIDFLVDEGIGIEVKTKGSKRNIHAQCTRYCGFDKIQSLILVTNLSMGFPDQINGKDCFVLKLGLAWL